MTPRVKKQLKTPMLIVGTGDIIFLPLSFSGFKTVYTYETRTIKK